MTPFSTIGATTDGPAEPGACTKGGYDQIGSDIWFAYVPTETGTVTVGTCDADFDTKIAVYAGSSCPTSASAVGCNDDGCGPQSEVTFLARSGQAYRVRVGGHDGEQGTGNIVLGIEPSTIADCQGIDGVDKLLASFDPQGLGAGEYTLDVAITNVETGLEQRSSIPFVVN